MAHPGLCAVVAVFLGRSVWSIVRHDTATTQIAEKTVSHSCAAFPFHAACNSGVAPYAYIVLLKIITNNDE